MCSSASHLFLFCAGGHKTEVVITSTDTAHDYDNIDEFDESTYTKIEVRIKGGGLERSKKGGAVGGGKGITHGVA